VERFYEHDKPQCPNKCIVGDLGRARVCICELVAGHEGKHERVPTMRLAGVKEFDSLPWYRHFVEKVLQ
jgi:hypothetical protein